MTRFGALCSLFALAVFAVPAGASAADSGDTYPVKSFEVVAYQANYGVSKQTAIEHLEAQRQGDSIVRQLKAAQGADYAGVWFDNERGEFVVPTLSGTPDQAVERALDSAGMEGDFRLTGASNSWRELMATNSEVTAKLEDASRDVSSGIDPKANAVVIRDGEGGPETRKELEQVAAEVDGDVAVRTVPAANVAGVLQQCAVYATPEGEFKGTSRRVCDRPLRAGVYIKPSNYPAFDYRCTAAFKATGGGNNYVLTAGHCLAPTIPGWEVFDWSSENSNRVTKRMGPVEGWSYPGNDYAAIRVSGHQNWWEEETAWPSQVVWWEGPGTGTNPNNPITAEGVSYVGLQVCHSGTTSGSSCGEVTQVDYANGTIDHGVFVQGATLCGRHGDSGGPYWAGSVAYGIHQTGPEAESCPNGWTVYTEITRATQGLGLSVGPLVAAPPVVKQTNPPNPIGYFSATASGVVDPNGGATTFRFEYGPTASYGSSSPSYGAGSSFDPVAVSGDISSLQPGTTYHYRLAASNAAGTGYGGDGTFTTPAPPPPAPRTGVAKGGTETGATLTGSVEQQGLETTTTYWFRYGHTATYGGETEKLQLAANSSPKAVAAALTGLEPGTTYHYRLMASNQWGTSEGADEAFTASWDSRPPITPSGTTKVGLEGISCATASECIAVGSVAYAQGGSSSNYFAAIQWWNGNGWGQLVPKNPAGALEVVLRSVSCPTTSFCMAVGDYQNAAGQYRTLIEKWNGSTWEIVPSPNNGPEASAANFLSGVSCASPSACEAVGYYRGAAGEPNQGLGMYWNGTSWQSQLVAQAEGTQEAYYRGVSCAAADECWAVGAYRTNNEWRVSFGLGWENNWNTMTMPNTVPAGAKGSWLESVSCGRARYCAAVGYYEDAAGVHRPLVETKALGNFLALTPASPEGAGAAELYGVSCSSISYCLASGRYSSAGKPTRSLAYAWKGGQWEAQFPFNPLDQAASDSLLSLRGLSCPRDGVCFAVGGYQNVAGLIVPHAGLFAMKVPPTVTTGVATAITDSGAQLHGKVNPNGQKTTYRFDYGTTTSYGSSTKTVETGEGQQPLELSELISGLSSNTTYHFRIVATNPSGTAVGEDATFKTPRKWTSQATPYHPVAGKPAKFAAVSCHSATVCTAVGNYETAAAALEPLRERWASGIWGPQPPPAGNKAGALEGIHCSLGGECAAVGYYVNPANKAKIALAERWNGTKWEIQTLPLPEGSKASVLRDVSCVSMGQCTAVGYYENAAGAHLPLAERWSGTAWAIQSIPPPKETTLSELTGVSCLYWVVVGQPRNQCVAVGLTEKAAKKEPLAEHWDGIKWEAKALSAPVGTKAAQLTGVSCPLSGIVLECMATGSSVLTTGAASSFISRWDGTAWKQQAAPSVQELNGISCVSMSNCVAVGSYLKTGVSQAFAAYWNGALWQAQLPPNPEGAKGVFVNRVSCESSLETCTAVGYYEDAAGVKRTLALRFS
jgi:hypothetical protein